GRCTNGATLNVYFPLRSKEMAIVLSLVGLMDHLQTVGVLKDQTFFSSLARRDDFNRTGMIHPKAPLSDVKHVRPPISHVSTTKFFVVPPLAPEVGIDGRCQEVVIRSFDGVGPKP